MSADLLKDAMDVLSEFLSDAETLNEPVRNEAICEKARLVLARRGCDHVLHILFVREEGLQGITRACVARLIQGRHLDARSAAGDALLDYLRIGSGGPNDVPAWMAQYEEENKLPKTGESHGTISGS